MKTLFFFILLYFILPLSSISSIINDDSNKKSLIITKNKLINIKTQKEKTDFNKKRFLSDNDDGFTPIRIFIDKTYMKKHNSESLKNYNKVMVAIEKCVNTIQKLIKVKKKDIIILTNNDLAKLNLNSDEIDENLLPSGDGIEADLIIIPKFIENDSIISLGTPNLFDQTTKRPIVGTLIVNKNLPNKKNIENYLESIILHQFTHILGFLFDLFNYYLQDGINNVIKEERETRTNEIKKFIITPKVVSYAKKYFNCNTITGVELEDGGGDDGYENSHWEARILLGEYMNSETHTAEQAISGFTLALLEDSGWYKTNNYTGGLMRFGKNQGCKFLNEDCQVKEVSKNLFKNDLFTYIDYYKATCSSGRQSRAYNAGKDGALRGLQFYGKKIADYCFVSDIYGEEEQKTFYVGNCNRGGGDYGQRIFYNSDSRSKNGDIPEIFGEKYSSNSFCVLSSAVPTLPILNDQSKYEYYLDITHPMCYPMFCSEKSLTIQINNQYIVCPREGGIVEIKGDFIGYIYCPDYNLICTGTVMCNDMFECVEKESLEKSDTFDYDYIIKTSQHVIDKSDLTQDDISIGYELSDNDDTKCPVHCSQCKENKQCFICEDTYYLIGSREDDDKPIICSQNTDLPNYYRNEIDGIYYLCMDNCLNCNYGNTCNECDPKYKLNQNNLNCEEKIPKCKLFDAEYTYCEECEEHYYLLNDDKNHCHNETIEEDKFFTEDGGKTYISCEEAIENCIKCDRRDNCNQCKGGYFFDEEKKECTLKIAHCKRFDTNYEFCEECDEGYYILNEDKSQCHNEVIGDEYFSEDNGKTFTKCENVIENCLKCENRENCILCEPKFKYDQDNKECILKIAHCKTFDTNYELCEECEEGYYLINENKLQCHDKHDDPIDDEKYFTEDEGKTYTNCETAIENCVKCEDRNTCNLCKDGYKFEQENKECNPKIPNCKTYDENFEYCKECVEGYYILNENKLQCHNEHDDPIDEEKYFTEDDGKIYISCEEAIENCVKCEDRNTCTQCIETHKIGENDKKCEEKIPNCKNYDFNFENCEECEEPYYLINNDLTKCQNAPINDSFFTEDNGKIFISCDAIIQNCLKCKERNKCLTCKKGYIFEEDNTKCILINDPNIECNININNINDKDVNFLKQENINKLVKDYITNNDNDLGKVDRYINDIYNYSITIFKYPECTENLLKESSYYLDTSNISLFYDNGLLINCFISYNSKNFINFYSSNGEKINMEENCPECLQLKYNIKNNFTDEFLKIYSPLIIEIFKKENTTLFSDENNILNNTCNSYDYGGLNIPLPILEKKFIGGEIIKGLVCTDQYCDIISQQMDDYTAECYCQINYELDYLLNDINKSNKDNLEQNLSDNTSIKTIDIFSCLFKNKNFNNIFKIFAFYLSASSLLIEITSFSLYLVFKQNINLSKYSPNSNKDRHNLEERKATKIGTEKKENNNIIPTEAYLRPSVCSIEKFPSNPPRKTTILYKYKWFKNKPKILSLENSHDEDLEIQSRDEGDPENEIMRKMKNISFFEKNSSNGGSSYLDDSLSDRDKITETSKNKITLIPEEKTKKIVDKIEDKKENYDKEKVELEILDISPKKEEKVQTLKNNALPQVLSREENARKKKRKHSIKNLQQQTKESTYPNKVVEEKIIKSPKQIYIDIIIIKQHIINFFSCFFYNRLDAESFIPLQMKIIRFIFLIILNVFFNTIFLEENYFIEKYNFFNDKYNLEKSSETNIIISNSEKINYSLNHCFKNSLISFALCLIVQLIIGILFFGTKRKIDNVIEIKEKETQEKEYKIIMRKIKRLFIVFFIVNFVLLIIFDSYITAFNLIYDKSLSDYLIPSLITFIFLQIIPFVISIIITALVYFGLKKENQRFIKIAKYLLF